VHGPVPDRGVPDPDLEVDLHAPDQVPLDRDVRGRTDRDLLRGRTGRGPARGVARDPVPAHLDAGQTRGVPVLLGRPVLATGRFESTPRLDKIDTTDGEGGAHLVLNPAIEPNARPRATWWKRP